MKLGSLFDGSGGFPLAGALCGIDPCWASEVEPYPIAVTRSRFPKMKHLGDINKINGAEVEPVDIITFGSPCQDLSVAGKRAGLKHEVNGDDETTRSGLFMEAVRIIKEMREATNGTYPRFALWENVPGTFSSNKGEDFRIVLEELIKIAEPEATMPSVPEKGWAYADSYIGDGWSIAYRVFDAQYWGVPQRRRRIHLIADFRGECAKKILFEREGLRGYFETGRTPWENVTSDIERGVGTDDREGEVAGVGLDIYNLAVTGDVAASVTTATGQGASNTGQSVLIPYTLKIRSGCEGGGKGALVQEDKSATLATNNDQYLFQPLSNILLDDQGGQQISVRTDGKSPTMGTGGGNVPTVMEQKIEGLDCYNQSVTGDKTMSLTSSGTDPHHIPCVIKCLESYQKVTGPLMANTHPGSYSGQDAYNDMFVVEKECITDSLTIDTEQGESNVCYRLQGNGIDRADTAGCNGKGWKEGTCYTLNTIDRPAVVYNGENITSPLNKTNPQFGDPCHTLGTDSRNYLVEKKQYYIVRRLTPTECARLQGFTDRWGDIEQKTEFTDEEYQFWLEVRNTHAAINGKQVKEYTVKQMLTWYNKLHTDCAEYKMWGNGIALPPAVYCIQGIVEACL